MILEHLEKKDEASQSDALPENRAPPARQKTFWFN